MSAGCSCGRRWTSLTQAHCQMCHRQFASVSLADKHHTYDEARRATCHDPEYVRSKRGVPVFRSSPEVGGPVWRSFERNTIYSSAGASEASSEAQS